MYDVLIVGAGPAGLSAALILGRCLRRVLVCDSGEPRNAVSPVMHGFVSRDGVAPRDFRLHARKELESYPTVEIRDVSVEAVSRRDGFHATLATGERVEARRLLLATGIVDELPEVPGLRELYGKNVWHCPYCDGYELRERPLAVYGRGGNAVAELRALTRYGKDLVLCSDGEPDLDADARACIERMGVQVRPEPVLRVEPHAEGLAILLETGEAIVRSALFVVTRCRQKSSLAESLGCKVGDDGLIATEDNQAAGVPGVYVAGDASRSALLAIVAAGEGAAAALAINKEILREDLA
jgi:thioredoxin reductase